MHCEVLVLGGGYTGLHSALNFRIEGYDVTLIDADGVHEFGPGATELLRGRVDRDKMELDLGTFLEGTGIRLFLETVESIKPEISRVETGKNTYEYDKLVVALGSDPRDRGFDISGLEHVYSMSAAARLRDKIEGSEHITIKGGGYTGIQVMGEIAETDTDVTLTTSYEKPISKINKPAPKLALDYMAKKDVDFQNERKINSVSETELEFKDGGVLETDAVVWCTGFKPKEIVRDSFEVGDGGFKVRENSRTGLSFPVIGYENVYGAGDCIELGFSVNNNDVISLGRTAIFNPRNTAIKSRGFRYFKDLVRYKHFTLLKTKKLRILSRNFLD